MARDRNLPIKTKEWTRPGKSGGFTTHQRLLGTRHFRVGETNLAPVATDVDAGSLD